MVVKGEDEIYRRLIGVEKEKIEWGEKEKKEEKEEKKKSVEEEVVINVGIFEFVDGI